MPKIIFLIVSISLYAVTFTAAYLKDSMMFASLFVTVLLISAGFYLFQFGNLNEFSLSAFSTNARFIRETAIEAKDYSDQIKAEKERIDKIALEIEELRDILVAEIEATKITANTALYASMTGKKPLGPLAS